MTATPVLSSAALGDHSAAICSLEAVLADGSCIRTGMGAVAGSKRRAGYKGGCGPSLAGAAANGLSPCRSHIAVMDSVAALHTGDGSSTERLVSRIKEALDPDGRPSPGKQEIWREKGSQP